MTKLVVLSVIITALSVFGTLINGFVLYIFCKFKTVRIRSNIFLISLAVSQLTMTCVVGPTTVVYLQKAGGELEWKMVKDCVGSLIIAPRVVNAIIAYDRYLHISLHRPDGKTIQGTRAFISGQILTVVTTLLIK